MSCLEQIEIDSCQKLEFESFRLSQMKYLQRIAFDRNVKVKYCELNNCQNLKTIKFGCKELVELTIHDCPRLEELADFIGPSCLERIIVDGCGICKYLKLKDCNELRQLCISGCPELESSPSFARLSCIEIDSCMKLQNITLPTALISLSIQSCRDLQRVAETGDLTKLTQLIIKQCPELEELPSLSKLSCLEEIEIDSCEKVQNITLPTTLIRLSVRSCRDLQRVAGSDDLTKLTRLHIAECPELEALPSLSRVSCLDEIVIDSCEKLQSISEFYSSEYMKLCYCNNALIRNCIDKLKCLPEWGMDMIGTAVDGVESALNENLYSEIATRGVNGSEEWSFVIGCFVVVVDSSTSLEDINRSLARYNIGVREGEWIITRVAWSWLYCREILDVLRRYGIMKKGFSVEVKRGEEGKSVLCTIVDRLHHL